MLKNYKLVVRVFKHMTYYNQSTCQPLGHIFWVLQLMVPNIQNNILFTCKSHNIYTKSKSKACNLRREYGNSMKKYIYIRRMKEMQQYGFMNEREREREIIPKCWLFHRFATTNQSQIFNIISLLLPLSWSTSAYLSIIFG